MVLMYSFSETNKIISEIRKRPALYNKNHADYNNKEFREQMWTDICWELYPNWSDLDEFDRQARFKDIQKRWKNMRDSFRKEIKIQSKARAGVIRKKREYVYYRQMKFMIPFILEQESSKENSNQDQLSTLSVENTEHEDDNDDDEDNNDAEEEEEEEYNNGEDNNDEEITTCKFESEDTRFSNSSHTAEDDEENEGNKEQPVLEMWDDNVENGHYNNCNHSSFKDVDQDRYFLLSLVPSFKTLSPQQKLNVKVEFLKVLQRISEGSSEKIT